MAKDYYKTLGVEKKASKEEIKKAFRKLAHEHHPDRGGSEAKFKEINEAYQILSSDEKRAEYDTYGQTFAGGHTPPGGGFTGQGWDFSNMGGFSSRGGSSSGGVEFDLGDIFGEFFSGRGGSAGWGGGRKRGNDISVDIEIPFQEAAFGVERSVVITKPSICKTCKGSGAAPGSKSITCTKCSGRGSIKESRSTIFGAVTMEAPCRECHGTGSRPETPCSECRGTGVLRQSEEIRLAIPSGIENGEMIRLPSMGEYVQGGNAGDLYVKVHVRPHQVFKREGNDISMELAVKLSDALLGATYNIPSLEGSELKVDIPEGTSHGTVLRIKDKGILTSRGKRGNLIIRIVVKMPGKLSKLARQLVLDLKQEGL